MADGPCTNELDVRLMSQAPLVAGTHMEAMSEWVTPTHQHFIRNHFPIPTLDTATWQLRIGGSVNREISLKYEDLKKLPSAEIHSLLECAGNSRASVQPQIEGLLWDNGAVGNANWKGVSVKTLLEQAGIKDNAVEILFEGADRGTENGSGKEINFAASLPMDKALNPETIVAYEMNGEPLTQEHGHPLRLVVPGWFGMASVKWLVGVKVLEQPFDGFHQTGYYVFVKDGDHPDAPKERVTTIRVKSLIRWPGRGAYLKAGVHTIQGVAWSGDGPVQRLEVSADNGATWREAKLEDSHSPYSWQHWEFDWDAREPGYHMLRARATDAQGNVQPERAEWNFRGFANNSIHNVPVTVLP